MHIYFVRHGETDLNHERVHQSPNTPLSKRGREQAESVGEYLRDMNPDLLITSEYTRARETAEVIGAHVGLVPRVEGDLYEVVRPSSLYHKSHFHPRTIAYVLYTVCMRRFPTRRYQDAENFADIERRATRTIEYLEHCRGTYHSIVVVSHTIFIHAVISYLCEHRLWGLWQLLLTALHIKQMKNTGIIHVVYDEDAIPGVCPWRIIDGV